MLQLDLRMELKFVSLWNLLVELIKLVYIEMMDLPQ